MNAFLVIEIILILFFLVMFLRQTNVTWAVGLLTLSTVVLLNVVRIIFDLDDAVIASGLWVQILGGLAFGGAAIWLFGLLRPYFGDGFIPAGNESVQMAGSTNGIGPMQAAVTPDNEQLLSRRAVGMSRDVSEYDRQLIYDQITQNLGTEDLLDLMFDLEMAENEIVAPTKDMRQTIYNIIEVADEREQMGDLALAVERILTPVPPDHFPRLSRITVESPPTILRRYLLTFYNLDALEEMADDLEIDWERLGIGSKQQKVRNLLLWVRRRNRMGELIEVMHARPVVSGNVNLK